LLVVAAELVRYGDAEGWRMGRCDRHLHVLPGGSAAGRAAARRARCGHHGERGWKRLADFGHDEASRGARYGERCPCRSSR